MQPGDLLTLAAELLFVAAKWIILIAVIVAGIVRWQRIRPAFKPGVMVGAALLLLNLPSMVASVAYIDPSMLFPEDESARTFAEIGFRVGVAGAFVFAFAKVFLVALQIGLGEDAFPQRSSYPTLLERPVRFTGWKTGALIGTVAALVSTLLFWMLDAELGPSIEWLRNLAPGYARVPMAVQLAIALPAVAGIAVAEEIFFRGVVQQWMVRLAGGGGTVVVAAIVLTSVFWSVGHAGNVEPAWFKLSQIFVLGLIFGGLAHRHGVESSCAAHVCLNLVATILGAALGWGS